MAGEARINAIRSHILVRARVLPRARLLLVAALGLVAAASCWVLIDVDRNGDRARGHQTMTSLVTHAATWLQDHSWAAHGAERANAHTALAAMSLVLGLVALLMRRWLVAGLCVLGPAFALELAERVLKPAFHGSYPSGHATGTFAVSLAAAAVCLPSMAEFARVKRRPLRAAAAAARAALAVGCVAMGFVLASYVVVTGAHTFDEVIGGIATAIAVMAALSICGHLFVLALAFVLRRAAESEEPDAAPDSLESVLNQPYGGFFR